MTAHHPDSNVSPALNAKHIKFNWGKTCLLLSEGMKEISYALLNISAQAEALLSGGNLNSALMSGIKPVRMWHLL